jgi:cysteine desulfurase
MKGNAIYLDYNASTPCDPRVVEAMLPYLTETYANPSSRHHQPGREAYAALEEARSAIARTLGCRSGTEIYFTSGATEANNIVLSGVAQAMTHRGRHIITQITEHPSVLEPLRHLQRNGWELTQIGVDCDGRIRLDELETSLRGDTVLVSLMLANNETGTVQPIREASRISHQKGAMLHCDAAQGVGKLALDIDRLAVDFLTLSGHKVYAPKGIGALFMRRAKPPVRLPPLIRGGGHEGGLRSGTPNLAGAVALARALEISGKELMSESRRLAELRDHLEDRVTSGIDGCTINGSKEHRLPGTSNLSFAGVDGNALLASLPDVAVSTGSACTSTHAEASPVLRAMGVPAQLAKASLRLSLGRFTTAEEVDRAAERIVAEVTRLRSLKRRFQST